MKRKMMTAVLALTLAVSWISGCSQQEETPAAAEAASETSKEETSAASEASSEASEEASEASEEAEKAAGEKTDGKVPADGEYSARFTTDSNMFKINEVYDDRGTLTVKDGKMTIHITLPSKNIVNLFPGTAEDAQKDGAELLEPTTDTVRYEDGTEEEVNGFDVPVAALDEPFQLALIGTKGNWYDHEVTVSDVQSPDQAGGDEDMEAAKKTAELIDAVYVQKWTEETDSLCEEARKAWDGLTDKQKELVEGEFADPDYFGADTGDASRDDPLNADDIGENELLVVSFGTSFNDSRAEDIGGIEKALAAAYPDWSVRRAFTSQIIINHIYARDGEKIDNVDQALERAVKNNVKNLVVQPTHLMHGAEYDELVAATEAYKDKMSITIAEPLLCEVGADATVINADKEAVAKAAVAAAVADAGAADLAALDADKTAIVFMGHGTAHVAKVTYEQMQAQMDALGYKNVFIGTVEGEPESTSCESVIEAVKSAGYTKVILRPLMVVAGDHANNDMADPEDEESWVSQFTASKASEKIDTQIAGLGRIADVQALYVAHTAAALSEI